MTVNSNQYPVLSNKGFNLSIWNLEFGIFTGVCLLAFGILTTGCSSTSSKPYDQALVTTYAELTLLYEKEKMVNKEVDSLYQVKVKDFFVKKGYQQEKFKEVIDELSKHPEAWKMFIQDVTTAMDSLKAIEANK